MGIKYIWDTNTAIYYLQQQFPTTAEKFIDDSLKEAQPCISAITEIELLCWKTATEKDLESELQRAAKAGCDVVFIDTPPGRSSEAMAAVELADLVLIPFENDQDAYTGVTKTAQLARRLGKEAYGVLNKAPPNSHAHEDTAREVLKAINLPLAPVALHRYDAYRLANVQGMAVQEFDPSSTPALQIEGLWNWLSALLQVSTSAPVHKKGAA